MAHRRRASPRPPPNTLPTPIPRPFAVPSAPPMNTFAQILVRDDVDLKTFREEIMPAAQPVVLKGLLNGWPAVRAAREGPRALADFICKYDRGAQVIVIECPRESGRRLF